MGEGVGRRRSDPEWERLVPVLNLFLLRSSLIAFQNQTLKEP